MMTMMIIIIIIIIIIIAKDINVINTTTMITIKKYKNDCIL